MARHTHWKHLITRPSENMIWWGSYCFVCLISITNLIMFKVHCHLANIFGKSLHSAGRNFKWTGSKHPTPLATPVWPAQFAASFPSVTCWAYSSTRAISYLAFRSGKAYTRNRRGQSGAVKFESVAACVTVWVVCLLPRSGPSVLGAGWVLGPLL